MRLQSDETFLGCFLAVCCLALSVEDAILLGLLQVAAYSLRRTSIGSTSEARYAGRQAAMTARTPKRTRTNP
jgi:hypothetical protein